MRIVPLFATCVVGSIVLAACNSITGVGDLGIAGASSSGDPSGLSDGGDAGGGGSGSDDGSSVIDGDDPDGGTSTDGGKLPASGVSPSLASCGTNMICIPNTAVWSPAVQPGNILAPDCPAGFPQERKYRTSGGGGCGCTCGGATCGSKFSIKAGPTCGDTATNYTSTGVGECQALATPLTNNAQATYVANGGSPACTGTPTSNLDPPRDQKICVGAEPVQNAACKADEVCVPKANFITGTFNCIVREGESACPARMGIRTLLADSITDGRSCSDSCTCTSSGCKNGTVRLFGNGSCSGGSTQTLTTDGTACKTVSPTGDASVAFQYAPGDACKVESPPGILGSETVTAPRTLCCALSF